jgi:hypothetical protein
MVVHLSCCIVGLNGCSLILLHRGTKWVGVHLSCCIEGLNGCSLILLHRGTKWVDVHLSCCIEGIMGWCSLILLHSETEWSVELHTVTLRVARGILLNVYRITFVIGTKFWLPQNLPVLSFISGATFGNNFDFYGTYWSAIRPFTFICCTTRTRQFLNVFKLLKMYSIRM